MVEPHLAARPVPSNPAVSHERRYRPPARGVSALGDRPDRLLALDIETVPDADLIPSDWPPEKFPKPAWHRVVAISFVEARIVTMPGGIERYEFEDCRSGGREDWDEPRLLMAFWKFFALGRYRLVTWNGRAFDVPVLWTRAMLYGASIPSLFMRGDRWNGYLHRYAPEWHADAMELLSGYGAATRMGLDEMAVAVGLPGKMGESGGNVASMVAAGRLGPVRDYCETDTLNTAGLYLRWALLSGRSDAAAYNSSVASLMDFLDANRAGKAHFGAFVDRWRASPRPVPGFVPEPRPPEEDFDETEVGGGA